MKIKLEAQKTCIKVNKDEFKTLLVNKGLYEKTVFPTGDSIIFNLFLEDDTSIDFKQNSINICLPNRVISQHKPNKVGLDFVL